MQRKLRLELPYVHDIVMIVVTVLLNITHNYLFIPLSLFLSQLKDT